MNKPSDNPPADPFKKALAEATKVMADDGDLSVTYSVDPPGLTGDAVRLPQVTRRMTREEVLLARGTADALALKHKFHDDATHARYAPPAGRWHATSTRRWKPPGVRPWARARCPALPRTSTTSWTPTPSARGGSRTSPPPPMRRWLTPRATWCATWPPGAICPTDPPM